MITTLVQPAAVALPKRDHDFFQMTSNLSDTEQNLLKRVTRLHGKPCRVDHQQILGGGLFSFEIVSAIRDLKIAGAGYEGYGCAACNTVHSGTVLC